MPQHSEILLEHFVVKTEADAYSSAAVAAACAERLGFEKLACLEIKTAVSEIAINAVRYARGGKVRIKSLNKGKVIEIYIHDNGDGIEDIEQAQQHGFTTTTSERSMGVGLSVAQRSVDEFIIDSEEGRGTKITLKKFLPISTEKAHYGIVSQPDNRYEKNGDTYVIKEYDGDKVLLAVIDGLGQGENAEYVANIAKKKIEECYRLELTDIIHECDKAIREQNMNSGVALALAVATKEAVYCAAIGDTHSKVFGHNNDCYILSQPGLVGNKLPRIRIKTIPIDGAYTVILCTDGIHDEFSCEVIPLENAQQTAEFIFNNFHGSHGDATVLVAKIKDL